MRSCPAKDDVSCARPSDSGHEYSGPDAGFAELFEGRWCILTLPGEINDTVEIVAGLWRDIGSEVEFMDARHHDLVLAITSHLPHLTFTIAVPPPSRKATRSAVIKYSASIFAISPGLLRPIRLCGGYFFAEQEAVFKMLGRFNEDLVAP